MILSIILKIAKHIISIPLYWIVFVLILEFIDYLLYRKP